MSDIRAKSVLRREDYRFLTGNGTYVADKAPANTAVALFLRSPHAHADIVQLDVNAARRVAGVLAVYLADDLTGVLPIAGGIGFKRPDGSPSAKTDRPLLARDRVRFVGEPVALVVAETESNALDALDLIAVEYRPLPAVTAPADAILPTAPAVWNDVSDNVGFLWKGGDADSTTAALASSAHVVELDFSVSRVTANSMEPRGVWARVTEDDRLEVHASHQSPFALRNGMASGNFSVPPSEIRVVPGDVGGSFGMKSGVHQEPVLITWAARCLRRPVRWVSGRTEGFLTDEQAREMLISAKLGLDKEGRFTALQLRWSVNLGAYVSGRSGWGVGNIGGIAGVYTIPYIAAEVCGIMTHTVPTAAYRGAGRPEATYTIERLIDVAARQLGIDPCELRRRNLIPSTLMPYKTALTFKYDCGDFEGNMTMAGDLADLAGYEARKQNSRRDGKLRGIGICNCIEVAGGPFLRPAKDLAALRLAPDGTLVLTSGSMSVGQGLETTMTQLVAERFGVAPESVRWEGGDTDLLPSGKGNGGSGALCIGGSAVMIATDKVIERAKAIAAELLEAAVIDVELTGGRFRIVGTDKSIDLIAVATAAKMLPGAENGLVESGEFTPTSVTFPNGTHICEVEIDPETGQVEILRYTAVEELGRVLNPMIVMGQIHGGVVQGIGQALGEVIRHDRDGQVITASFMDYQMPRADEYPSFCLATREIPTLVNPLGAKGVGEAGTVGALGAAMNAINDALAAVGVRHFDMPATPERVWRAIHG